MTQLTFFEGASRSPIIVRATRLEEITIVEAGFAITPDWKPQGPNYMRLCLFHEERHASFYIRPAQNRFVCYGCGVQGGPLMLLFERHPDQRGYLKALEDVEKLEECLEQEKRKYQR